MPEQVGKSANELAQERTDMANARTIMAADRTLMAWIRTSLSLISFGFTIYKFLESVKPEDSALPPGGPRRLGMTLITLGVVSLILASAQHVKSARRMGVDTRELLHDLALWIAAFIGVTGLVMLIDLVFKLGLF